MDRITALEAQLADYIGNLPSLSREELIQEIIQLKALILESDIDLVSPYASIRHIQN